MTPKDITCDHCGRYIGKAHGTVVATLLCPNSSCKAEKQVKIVEADNSKAYSFKFTEAAKPPKEKRQKEEEEK